MIVSLDRVIHCKKINYLRFKALDAVLAAIGEEEFVTQELLSFLARQYSRGLGYLLHARREIRPGPNMS